MTVKILDEHKQRSKAYFFIHCSQCNELCPGKLRVRCSLCKGGAFTVHQDPECWPDVLKTCRIRGCCESQEIACVDTDQGDFPFAEFYFKCAKHSSGGESDFAAPLNLIKINIKNVPCLACTDVLDTVLVFPCASGHVTCLDCFRQYCASRLMDRQFISHPDIGYTLPCPAGCDESFIDEIHHFKLLTKEQYDRYQRFATEEFVLQSGGVLCPQPGCGMGLLVVDDCLKVVCQQGCDFVFCKNCLQGFHLGECLPEGSNFANAYSCQYAVDPERAADARWDEASKVMIKVITKPCPQCRTPTERAGGCMHMVCTRSGCGFEWCWVCQTEWTRDCMGAHWFGNIQTRYVIGGVLCFASIIYMIVQSNMSINILAMTKPLYNTTGCTGWPRYEWSAYDQSLVIGSFSWGSVAIKPFIGVFAERYGARNIGGISLVVTAILSTLTPVAASVLWISIVLRFFTGIVMGTMLTLIQALIANWFPPEEKGIFLSSLLANGIGTVIDWSMSEFIIEHVGWHYAFYVVVVILAIFAVVWYFVVYDSPSSHPRISPRERDFIAGKVKKTVTGKKTWPPFRSIFLSVPFYALVILQFGASWGIFFYITAAPRYLNDVHNFKISITGLLGSILYLARFIGGVSFGLIGDFILKRKIMSVTMIRKCFSLCSHVIPGCLLIGLTFFGDQPYVCVAFISVSMGISGATTITNLQNPHDIAPNFAVTIYSLGAVLSNTPGFLAPLVVAYYTQERSSVEEWRYIFFIGGGIYIATAVVYILFGTGNVQKWNEIVNDSDATIDEPEECQKNNVQIKGGEK